MIQVVIISILPGDAWGLSEEIHLATYFMLGAFLVANRHIPGLLVIALGGALNFAAIATNGGVMPADPDAIEAAGIPQKAGDFTNSAPASDAPLGFLGDVFHTPAWLPIHNVFSVGDIEIVIGAFLLLHFVCRSRLGRTCRSACAPRRHDAVRAFGAALKARGARRFFLAHAQSSLGSGIAIVGLPLLAYDHYHTPWALTAVLLCELLPAVAARPAARRARRPAAAAHLRWWRPTCCASARSGRSRCVPSLGLMIACALVAGIGTALFNPSALASLSQLAPPEHRPAAMSLYSALDDLGLTLGPALAGALLLVVDPHILMAINAVTFTLSAGLLATLPLSAPTRARPRGSLLASMRAGAREIVALPGRAAAARLLDRGGDRGRHGQRRRGHARPRAARRRRLRPRRADDGLRHRHVPRLDLRRAHRHELAVAQGLHRRASMCMAGDLVLCAVAPYFGLLVFTFALGGFGNGLALVHDRLLLAHTVPEPLHGRLFALHKTCTSAAFVIAFVLAGALISTLGIQAMFLCGGLALIVIIVVVRPPLRALWPEPAVESAQALRPRPGTT